MADTPVQKARKRIDRLREQIDAEKLKAAQKVHEGNDKIVLAAMERQERELEAELAALKATNKDQDSLIKEQAAAVASPAPTASDNESKAAQAQKEVSK